MITISKIQDRRFESRLDETGGLQVVIHLTCLVRTGMTVLRWYYLSQSFFTIAELRADLKNLYGRDPDTRQPYISNAVSLRTGVTGQE